MAAKFPQELSSPNDKGDVSLQALAELSEKNKALVIEYDDSTNRAIEDNGLSYEDKEMNADEDHDRDNDDEEEGEEGKGNDENFSPPQDDDIKIENENKISSAEWEQLKQKISVKACLEIYCENEVRLAILELVRGNGYFRAGTKAIDFAELIKN